MRMRGRTQRGERGAVLIMVGVFSMVMVAMTAFVVDIGNQRQNRLQLTTATDAAALDVAQEWANADLDAVAAGFDQFVPPQADKWDCTDVAVTIAQANNDGVDPEISCVAEEKVGDWGVVTVAAREAVQYQFGQAVGQSEGNTRATTSVKVTGAAQGGLRPFAICANLPAVKNFIDDDPTNDPVGGVEVDAIKHLNPLCGTASGNWGLLDLDGNGAKSVAELFSQGYAKSVKKSAGAEVCVPTDPESCFAASPGAKWNAGPLKTALDYLEGPVGCEAGGPEFSVPTYETVLDPNGKNAKFPLTGFLRVQLMCFSTGGSNLNGLTLRLVSYDAEECCSGVSETNRILEICDVGTIGGALGPDFESLCGTVSAPPTVGEGCGIEPIAPETQDVLVKALGETVNATHVDVVSYDSSKCGDIRLRIDVKEDVDRSVAVAAPSLTGNTYRFTIPANTNLGFGGTFSTLVVYEDDHVWDQSASLRTITDAGLPDPTVTCDLTSLSPAPALAQLKSAKSTQLEEGITWTADFAWPSNCGKITATLESADSDESITVMPAKDVSAQMVFSLDKNTKLPGPDAEDLWHLRLYHGSTLLEFPEHGTVSRVAS